MESRIVKTKFWQDEKTQSLTIEAKLLFIYLITCPHIGKTGVFELADSYILLETGLNKEQLIKAKKELEEKKRAFFFNSWIFVVNALKHTRYDIGVKTSVGFVKELENLPQNIKAYINKLNDSSIGKFNSSIGDYIKHKTETIKHNRGKIEEKKEEISIVDLDEIGKKIK